MKTWIAAATLAAAALIAQPGQALDANYSAAQEAQFLDWCTGTKSASEGICSCTLKSISATVPTQALTMFLNSQGAGGMPTFNQGLVATTASVTQALAVCSR
ncbi:hypothetical protein [Magnetospira sp. QH-2]|uniref:hypothetical protein n=1 Tax=Magnetospira sp. (strain QH-2) TaxID=1288970 RepID=UPI0003E80AF8|nr:hypothetical protein [Magnetospira sp. QH-2]CCQ73786.1 Exported protein of unknown function [Magnetospira sp. QH-2]